MGWDRSDGKKNRREKDRRRKWEREKIWKVTCGREGGTKIQRERERSRKFVEKERDATNVLLLLLEKEKLVPKKAFNLPTNLGLYPYNWDLIRLSDLPHNGCFMISVCDLKMFIRWFKSLIKNEHLNPDNKRDELNQWLI